MPIEHIISNAIDIKNSSEIKKDKNIYIAKKSLFHSFRIIDFGTQIAKNGRITDYGSTNHIWFEIRDKYLELENWSKNKIIYINTENKTPDETYVYCLEQFKGLNLI